MTGKSGRVRALIAGAVAGILAVGVTIAVNSPGFEPVRAEVSDPTIWVANAGEKLVGRVNEKVAELNSAVAVAGTVEVLQNGTAVVVHDLGAHEIQTLDRATAELGPRVPVPERAQVVLGGDTVAVLDLDTGALWVGVVSDLGTLDRTKIAPTLTAEPGSTMTVSTAGATSVIGPGQSAVTLLGVPTAGVPVAVSAIELSGGPVSTPLPGRETGQLQITVVGDQVAVLDRQAELLRLPTRTVSVPEAATSQLQQAGPDAEGVLLATENALLRIPFTSADTETLIEVDGTPVRPLMSGCIFGLWTGNTATVGRTCADGSTDKSHIPAVQPGAELALRQQGSVVVVNDSRSGATWLAGRELQLVDNWDQVVPPESEKTADQDSTESAPDQLATDAADCSITLPQTPNTKNDRFGVRVGRAAVLRVLGNDPAAQCAAVRISAVTPLDPTVGRVDIVDGGQALQVTALTAGSLGPLTYTVDNGVGDSAEGLIEITAFDDEPIQSPEPVRESVALVESGGTVDYNVVDDFMSPTGDDFFLLSATSTTADSVLFRPDGTVTFRDKGKDPPGTKVVEFVISDGEHQIPGELLISVRATDTTEPVAGAVSVRAVSGVAQQVPVLASVTSAAVKPVQLVKVSAGQATDPVQIQVDSVGGTVTLTGTRTGTYYLTYDVAVGDHVGVGVIRLDVTDSAAADAQIVPMADVAYLPSGQSVVVDPLANDTDPAGFGLAIRQVAGIGGPAVLTTVSGLHLVRISTAREMTASAVLQYQVSDGSSSATGQIRVVPVPAPQVPPPPLAQDIHTVVRAGDAVTIKVADYAVDPLGSPVRAALDDAEVAVLPGRAFSSGSEIRYLAPDSSQPAPVVFSYTVTSEAGGISAVRSVTITVTDPDLTVNAAPRPPNPLVARVFAGSSVSITLPLQGTDPDGDWVVLAGINAPEAPLGETSIGGPDVLRYKAFQTPGVEILRYIAADTSGATVTGEVTVIVVPKPDAAAAPSAPDLKVSVRPGRTIGLDPLGAVTDSGGAEISFGAVPFEAPADWKVKVQGTVLVLQAPTTEGTGTIRYNVTNSFGLSSSGAIAVTVSETAVVLPPTAKDQFVDAASMQLDARTVTVDISSLITNPSGLVSDLTLSIDPVSATAATVSGPRSIEVSLAARRQVVAYRVTNQDGLTATAFIVVPPVANLVGPQLKTAIVPLVVDAGESVRGSIGEYVLSAPDRTLSIVADQVPTSSQGSIAIVDPMTFEFTAPIDAGGAAVLYVTVTDSLTPSVLVSIPVQIVPRLVPPPGLSSASIDVEVGTSGSIDLLPLASAVDAEQQASLVFSAAPGDSGFTTELNSTVLTVTVALNVPRNTSVQIQIQVADAQGQYSRATVNVRASGSLKPLPTIVNSSVPDGRAGVTASADVLLGATDPVGAGLHLVGEPTVTSGSAAGPPVLVGSTISVTPAAGQIGDLVVGFTVSDGTDDPERYIRGTFTVSVQDVPSAPGTPAVVAGSKTADSLALEWDASDPHGSPVLTYVVSGSGVTQECPGDRTSCVITGLITGLDYSFSMVAVNGVGQSERSESSAPVRPDAPPIAPAPPIAQYLERGVVSVSWTPPVGSFSPVTSMDLQIYLDGQLSETRPGASSPLVLSGLNQGGSYSFAVRAGNAEGTSGFSAPSPAVIPSGVPSAPAAVSAQFVYNGTDRYLAVAWQPPADDGGEPVQSYTVIVNGSAQPAVGSEVRTASISVGSPGTVSISVVAANGRGTSAPTAAAPVEPFERPGGVPDFRVTAPGDSTLALSWGAAASPGRPLDHYEFRMNGGGWVPVTGQNASVSSGLQNGVAAGFEIRACNTATDYDESVRCGPVSAVVSAVPYGELADPSVESATEKFTDRVKVTWTFPDGNGRPVVSTRVQIEGIPDGQIDVQAGTWTGSVGYETSRKVTVTYCVSGPDDCRTKQVQTVETGPAPTTLIVLDPVAGGTCRWQPDQVGGPISAQDACTTPSTWLANAATVQAICGQTGAEYAVDEATPTPATSKKWVKTVAGQWVRAAALTGDVSGLPPC